MNNELLKICRHYADTHAAHNGVAATPVPGLTIVRSLHPDDLQVAVSKPLLAMLLQGRKRVSTGANSFEYGPGEAMVISADIPTVSQITKASASEPYYSLVLELNIGVLRELQAEMPAERSHVMNGIHVERIRIDVADSAYRLVKLLENNEALNILGNGIVRELHYWLLRSEHGAAIRALATVDSHAGRINRAIAILRNDFMQPISIRELASASGMSLSVFHQHFRALTSLTPLQFQKQLRLIHARNLMLTNGMGITHAASAVGYTSASQFTREYARMFDSPPGRDIKRLRVSVNNDEKQ